MKTLRLLLVLLLAVLAGAGSASAAEEIRSFRADIEINAGGTLEVTERILVNVEGREIRRGIFRDIPLRFEDENGQLREVGLEILSVTATGRASPTRWSAAPACCGCASAMPTRSCRMASISTRSPM